MALRPSPWPWPPAGRDPLGGPPGLDADAAVAWASQSAIS
jgi:hypothetical protein